MRDAMTNTCCARRGARRALRAPVVRRRPRPAQERRDPGLRARGARSRRASALDGSALEGAARGCASATSSPTPIRAPSRSCRGGPARSSRACSATCGCPTGPVRGRLARTRCARVLRQRGRPRLHLPGRRRDRVLPVRRARADGERAADPLDDGAYFDLTPLDVGSDFRRAHDRVPRADGHPGQGVAPRGGRLASTRSTSQHTDALSMADAITTFRLAVKEVARRARRVRDVHAQAAGGPCRARACTCTCRCSSDDRNAFHDPRSGAAAVGARARLPGRRARPRAGADRGHQPVGQLLQAPGRPASRRRSTSSGRATATAALVRVPVEPARARRRPRGSSCARPTPPATRTCPSRSCSPPGCAGIERGYQLPAEARRTAAAERRRAPARGPARGDRRASSAPSSRARRSATRMCDWFVRNKRARVGRVPQDRHRAGSAPLPEAALSRARRLDLREPSRRGRRRAAAAAGRARLQPAPRRRANGSLRPTRRRRHRPARPPAVVVVVPASRRRTCCARLRDRRGARRRAGGAWRSTPEHLDGGDVLARRRTS